MAGELTARGLLERVGQRVGKTISSATRQKIDTAISRIGDAQAGMDEAVNALGDLIASVDEEAEKDRAVRGVLPADATPETVQQLVREAEAGRTYRSEMIDNIVQARTAIAGDGFTAEQADRYRARLASYAIEDLKDERDLLTTQRSQAFTAGRQVPAGDPNAETKTTRAGVVEETVE